MERITCTSCSVSMTLFSPAIHSTPSMSFVRELFAYYRPFLFGDCFRNTLITSGVAPSFLGHFVWGSSALTLSPIFRVEVRYGDIRNSTVSDNATVSVTPRFIRDCPFTTGHDLTGVLTSSFAVRSTVVEPPRYFTTRTGMTCVSIIVYHFGYSKF